MERRCSHGRCESQFWEGDDRVKAEERFFKKEPMDAPGYADLAARRRELLKNRLEARKDIGEDRLQGQEGL